MEGNLKEIFGYVLRELRERKGVSQQNVADNCNFERVFISRLERGLAQPTITTVFKLAAFFEIPPQHLIERVYDVWKKQKKELL